MEDKPLKRLPPLEELVTLLQPLTGLRHLATDVPLADLGVDSLELFEWLFVLEDSLDTEFDVFLDIDIELEAWADVTIEDLYTLFQSQLEREYKSERGSCSG